MQPAYQPGVNPQRERIPQAEFAAKFQSKSEAYHFLAVEVGAYCPPKDTITIWHLRDMANNDKGIVQSSEAKHLHVPHYDTLSQ